MLYRSSNGGDLLSTVRLTAAQALVRFLTEQYVERDGIERRFFSGCFGIFGHGNVAGVGQALQQYAGRPPLLPGPQRAGDGTHGLGLRPPEKPPPNPRLHDLHRARRHQHGYGSGPRHDKPPARAAPARRRLRLARTRPRTAAARDPPRRDPLGQRLFPAGLSILGQDLTSRAGDRGRPRSDARAHGPGRDGGRYPRAPAGRAGGGLRLSGRVLRETSLARRTPFARCRRYGPCTGHDPGRPPAHDRGRRGRHLLGGHGSAAAPVRTHRHPCRRDAGGQGLACPTITLAL